MVCALSPCSARLTLQSRGAGDSRRPVQGCNAGQFKVVNIAGARRQQGTRHPASSRPRPVGGHIAWARNTTTGCWHGSLPPMLPGWHGARLTCRRLWPPPPPSHSTPGASPCRAQGCAPAPDVQQEGDVWQRLGPLHLAAAGLPTGVAGQAAMYAKLEKVQSRPEVAVTK